MSQLYADYEKQFGILSADITAKIGKVPNLAGGKRVFWISSVSISVLFYGFCCIAPLVHSQLCNRSANKQEKILNLVTVQPPCLPSASCDFYV